MRYFRQYRFVIGSVVVYAGITLLAVLLLRPVLLISITNKDTLPALVAGIALTGTLTGAGVTLAGILLRQSMDLRTARLAEVEQDRLKMQTVMEAVKLMTAADGQPSSAVQISSGLIAVARLNELPLALDLAAEVWPTGGLTARAASGLCNSAIESKDQSLCRAASFLLMNNWMRLESTTSPGQYEWPPALKEWPPWLDQESKSRIKKGLAAWIIAVPTTMEDDFRQALMDDGVKGALPGS